MKAKKRSPLKFKKYNSKSLALFMVTFAVIGVTTLLIANAQSTTFYGKLWDGNKEDTYRLDVPSHGKVRATLSVRAKKGEQAAKLRIMLKDKYGKTLTRDVASRYNGSVYIEKTVNPGPYYLEVTSDTRLSSRGVSFIVSVQYPDERDTLLPVVTINDSDQLANVRGTVIVTGKSNDSSGIKVTKMIINGSVKASVASGDTWEFTLDSTKYANGTYEFVIESEDNAGNKGKSGISMVIDNTPPEEPEIISPEVPVVPPIPAPTPDSTSFLSGSIFDANYSTTNISNWSYEESGSTEKLVTAGDHVECHVGGYASSTHYARVRRKLPERDNFTARKRFSVESTFELPTNFYSQHESYMRLITTDNYPAALSGSGTKVGALNGDEWRLGFTIYGGDGIFRLISDHENNSNIILWKNSSKLPVGKHTVKINFAPSKSNSGTWEVYIDGVKVGSGSNVQTVPSSVADSEIAVTRVGGCIDGASNQDSKTIQANLYSIIFKAER